MTRNSKILIIGAGAAGIAAAARLLENGYKNLLILEAKNRIGGRIHTVQFSENIIELGAQWCHGEDENIVYNLACPYNLLESSKHIEDSAKHIFVNSVGEVLSEQETIEILRIYYKIINNAHKVVHKPQTSYGDYFKKYFYKEIEKNSLITKEKAEQILNWMHNYHNSIECSDTWFDVSANRSNDYWICKGDPLINWKMNGYSKVFDLLTKKFPNNKQQLPVYEKILFNKEISLIDYNSKDFIKVITSDGSVFVADSLIFTPSLGVLKENYLKLFNPCLPKSKIQAIKGLSIGVANKVFLEFSHRWWPLNIGGFCFMWSEDQKKHFLEIYGKERYWLCDVFKFFTVDYQPRVLSGWIVGRNAKYIEKLTDQKVLNEFYFILKKFLGHIYDIPKPQAILRSKWFSDKHFRGSYSFHSINTERLNINSNDLGDPIIGINNKPIILFAGEATHDHYFSTVHGAIETGFREANRLIDYYRYCRSHL
ncbi:PREDICTED: spermine oxidase-like [Ceratosolen solmsi marchali]|uniref:Spermine oxidase-like n=1 Tax=Ceratosolen solmsi marchali TaxID=326594 RepID=A0AAJ6YFD1_9HYME|nr:PREDICTED: spermine oxidase-like [Ceratosolen solmsi marchali]